jgi:membrane fusion protein (multidrug efflux system)
VNGRTLTTGLVLIGSAMALAGCGASGRAHNAPTATPSPAALPSDVQAVAGVATSATPGTAGASADPEAAGTLPTTGEFVPPVRSELAAKVQGRVGKVFVDLGAQVKAGQPLLAIEDDYFKLDVQRAEAEAARTAAAALDARHDFDRKKDLVAKGSVTQALFERAQATQQQADAAKAAADSALALARQRLADAVLVSPIDGVVMERRADVGERLGEATVAFVVVQTAPLKLRFRVPERYLATVRRGQPVKASVDPYPGEVFEGTVAVIVQAVDPATRTFGVEAEFANRDGRLKPGLFARVNLELPRTAEAQTGGGRAQTR